MGRSEYVLGSEAAEIARLDVQAASIAAPTELILRASGIAPGMRVLDLGTGLGSVAFAVADLVGPRGAVVGIDQSDALLGVAEARRAERGRDNVRFAHADARAFRDDEPFDAVVTRLLLFHLPDAVDVVRHHLGALRPGGLFCAVDFDIGAARTEPPVALAATGLAWIMAAFRSANADPVIGTHLAVLLRRAGVRDVDGLGVVSYFAPDDPRGAALLAGVIGSLAPQIVAAGIATEDELGLDTLQDRLARDVRAAGATFIPPAVTGAWGAAPRLPRP